jgi:hypothetical protein
VDVRRWALGKHAGGHLLYVRRDGEVVDLGAYERDEVVGLAWAWRVAYRATRDRGERSQLARARDAAARLGEGAKKL